MLIELMLAVTLGLLLVSVVLEMYLTSIRNDRLQQALNQIQQNAKITIDILNSDIHKAGYIGCARLTADFPIFSSTPYTLTFNNRISSQVSNEIVIRHASFPNAIMTAPMLDSSILTITQHVHFVAGDIAMISDCQRAEIFQMKEIKTFKDKQIIHTFSPLQHKYGPYAEVSRLEINTYFVANTHRTYADGTPIYSLFVKDIHQRKSELVEGIQYMSFHLDISDRSRVVGTSMHFTVVTPLMKKIWYSYIAING